MLSMCYFRSSLSKTFNSHSTNGEKVTMYKQPIHWEVKILLVASCCKDRNKLRPEEPLGSYADFAFLPIE